MTKEEKKEFEIIVKKYKDHYTYIDSKFRIIRFRHSITFPSWGINDVLECLNKEIGHWRNRGFMLPYLEK